MSKSITVVNDEIRNKSSFGKTFYYVDTKVDRNEKGPNQMKGLIKWMVENKITSPKSALQGSEIGTRAIDDGHVVTAKLTGPVIFAYYARRMEAEQGLKLNDIVHAKSGQSMIK